MLKWLLVVLSMGLATSCVPSQDGGPYYPAKFEVAGSASLGVDQAVKVTAVVRLREPLPVPSPVGGNLSIQGYGRADSADGYYLPALTRVVGVPGDFDAYYAPISPDFDPRDSFFDCSNGVCEGDVVMYVLPSFAEFPYYDADATWPVELEWELVADVGSTQRMGDPPVELEIVTQEIVAGHVWEATAEVDYGYEPELLWQAHHYTIDLPPELMPHPGTELSSWAWISYSGYGVVLDEGTAGTFSAGGGDDGIMCVSEDGCESLGFFQVFILSPDARTETVIAVARGVRIGDDISSEESAVLASATATGTAGPDQAARTTLSGTLNATPPSRNLRFSISLDHPGHTSGWPVIAYIEARKRHGQSDVTESERRRVLTDCRRTPCSGNFAIGIPDSEASIEWHVEAVVVPWSNEDTEGIEIEVAALP